MSEEIVNGSQTETTPEATPERDAETEALYAEFGMPPKKEESEVKSEEGEPPAKEETLTETKKLTVKFNKEDVAIDEDKIPEYVQKGLALDKERERRTKDEQLLKEAAMLLGLDSLDEATIEKEKEKRQQQQQKQEEDSRNQRRAELRAEAEEAGLDPDKVEQWLDNQPEVKEAKRVKEEQELAQKESGKVTRWNEFYQQYPELGEQVQSANGQQVEWYTEEFHKLVEEGNRPLLVYEYLNRDKIQTQTKKAAEQKVIKQQHLGARSLVEGQAATQPDEVTLLPEQMALAAEFGVNLEGVKRQQQLLSRR